MSSHEIYPAALSGADSVEHLGATSRRGYSPKQSEMGRAYEDVIQIIARQKMTITPTIALGGYQAAVIVEPSLLQDPRMKQLQPAWVVAGGGLAGGLRGGPGGDNAFRRVIARSAKTIADLQRAGVQIIAGVDAPLVPNGLALHTEIAGYVEAGLTPFQALQTATIITATLLNAQEDLGTIEPGKLADLVIVEGNPLVNIWDTVRVRTVIRDGEVIAVEDLLAPAKK